VLHFSFEKKNWRLKRVICGIRVAHQRHACIQSTPYLCVLYNPCLPHDGYPLG
jgi:hypothetical protein